MSLIVFNTVKVLVKNHVKRVALLLKIGWQPLFNGPLEESSYLLVQGLQLHHIIDFISTKVLDFFFLKALFLFIYYHSENAALRYC